MCLGVVLTCVFRLDVVGMFLRRRILRSSCVSWNANIHVNIVYFHFYLVENYETIDQSSSVYLQLQIPHEDAEF